MARDAKKDLPAREEAVRQMAKAEVSLAVPRLSALVADESVSLPVRLAGVKALPTCGGPQATEALIAVLGSARPNLREAAAEALGMLGGDEARRSMEGQLEHEEDLSVRETLQQSLSKIQP